MRPKFQAACVVVQSEPVTHPSHHRSPRKHGSTGEQNTAYAALAPVASPARAHGDRHQDGSERSLNSSENQWSIGFQPVFFCILSVVSPRVVYKPKLRAHKP
jgi:hypothetical protein